MAAQIKSIVTGEDDNYKIAKHPTIFHYILESNLPPEEKKLDRLWQEGQTIIGAGTETTAMDFVSDTVSRACDSSHS